MQCVALSKRFTASAPVRCGVRSGQLSRRRKSFLLPNMCYLQSIAFSPNMSLRQVCLMFFRIPTIAGYTHTITILLKVNSCSKNSLASLASNHHTAVMWFDSLELVTGALVVKAHEEDEVLPIWSGRIQQADPAKVGAKAPKLGGATLGEELSRSIYLSTYLSIYVSMIHISQQFGHAKCAKDSSLLLMTITWTCKLTASHILAHRQS